MNRAEMIKKLESLEANAHRLLDDAATLKEELSGGSDSSTHQVLSFKHREAIIQRRRSYLK